MFTYYKRQFRIGNKKQYAFLYMANKLRRLAYQTKKYHLKVTTTKIKVLQSNKL